MCTFLLNWTHFCYRLIGGEFANTTCLKQRCFIKKIVSHYHNAEKHSSTMNEVLKSVLIFTSIELNQEVTTKAQSHIKAVANPAALSRARSGNSSPKYTQTTGPSPQE